jgi:hypothetical protein
MSTLKNACPSANRAVLVPFGKQLAPSAINWNERPRRYPGLDIEHTLTYYDRDDDRSRIHGLGICCSAAYSATIAQTQYIILQHGTVQYSTVQYSTVQYSTVQCSAVQYSTVQRTGMQSPGR